jgi:hypothetical protein
MTEHAQPELSAAPGKRVTRRLAHGMGRVFQRGGSWWIAYCHRGREIRESVARALRVVPGSVRESHALALLKRRTGELQGGKFVGPPRSASRSASCSTPLTWTTGTTAAAPWTRSGLT